MSNEEIRELKEQEIERLSQEEELFDLETLITEGKDAKIPITFTYPIVNKKVAAVLKPLTSTEWNNCMRRASKFKTSFQMEVVAEGLLDKNEEPIKRSLIEMMPQGAINELYWKIAEITGIHEDKEDLIKAGKKMMGF